MTWKSTKVSPCGTHHTDQLGRAIYGERFDAVLKFHPPGLAAVSRDGRAWHIGSDGSPAYKRPFLRAFGFYEGLAAVHGQDGFHHIGPDGRDAYAERYAWCGNFQGQRCAVRDDEGRYFHITPEGEPAYSGRWRYAGDFRDSVAVVQGEDGRSTHIFANGEFVHGRWFIDLDVFHKGHARAQDQDGWMHIDQSGKPIYGRRFKAIEPFYNGQARVEEFNSALEVIDESGSTLVSLRSPLRSEFAALSGDLVGFWRTQTIAAAVELGVVDVLPASRLQVADKCSISTDSSYRILRALGELGIVVRRDDLWALTERGEFLRADHPLTLSDAAIEYAGPFTSMWRKLADAMRQGADWRPPDIFSDVAQFDARCTSHHRMLQSYARHDYATISDVLSMRGDERVIDAGGGLGVLASALLKRYPSLDITVLERPEVVSMAADSIPGLSWLSGILFASWGVSADVAILSRVLHDWDDESAVQILKNARAVLPQGGRLFIIEMIVPENGMFGALCDLHLMMATGGRERSVSHFERLLNLSGFELTEVRNTEALPSVVVGVAL